MPSINSLDSFTAPSNAPNHLATKFHVCHQILLCQLHFRGCNRYNIRGCQIPQFLVMSILPQRPLTFCNQSLLIQLLLRFLIHHITNTKRAIIFLHNMFSLCTPMINHIYNDQTGKQETIDTLLAGSNAQTWRCALSNRIGRLDKGVAGCVAATETIKFIHKHEVPCDKKVTYTNMVCDYCP